MKIVSYSGKSLKSLSAELSSGQHNYDFLDDWEIGALYCHKCPSDAQSFLNNLIDPINYSYVLTQIHQKAGPDLALLLKHRTTPTEIGILFIQAKCARNLELEKALHTVDPCKNVYIC